MQKLIKNLAIWGAVFVIIFGTLLHFFYDWSGHNFLVGFLAPINESVWEHMKLVFTPMILFAFIDYYYLRGKVDDYCFALLKQISFAIIFIIAVFYIYTSFVGHSVLAIDISSFIVAVILAKWFGYAILTKRFKQWEFKGINTVAAIVLVALAAFFVLATINPPQIGLFKDPVDNTYGTDKNSNIMPGSDRDSHGCIGSAGYTWCESKSKCLRTWEETCQ